MMQAFAADASVAIAWVHPGQAKRGSGLARREDVEGLLYRGRAPQSYQRTTSRITSSAPVT